MKVFYAKGDQPIAKQMSEIVKSIGTDHNWEAKFVKSPEKIAIFGVCLTPEQRNRLTGRRESSDNTAKPTE